MLDYRYPCNSEAISPLTSGQFAGVLMLSRWNYMYVAHLIF